MLLCHNFFFDWQRTTSSRVTRLDRAVVVGTDDRVVQAARTRAMELLVPIISMSSRRVAAVTRCMAGSDQTAAQRAEWARAHMDGAAPVSLSYLLSIESIENKQPFQSRYRLSDPLICT
jgi:hypothetical protein